MGKEAPSFQFYPADFLSATDEWEPEEVGVYIRLLASAWVNRSLPTDLPKLARVGRVTPMEMESIWGTVGEKFLEREDGRLVNPRLEQIRAQQKAYSEKQRENARRRWEPEECQTDATAYPTADATAYPRRMPPHIPPQMPEGVPEGMPNASQTDALHLLTSTSTSKEPPPTPPSGGGGSRSGKKSGTRSRRARTHVASVRPEGLALPNDYGGATTRFEATSVPGLLAELDREGRVVAGWDEVEDRSVPKAEYWRRVRGAMQAAMAGLVENERRAAG